MSRPLNPRQIEAFRAVMLSGTTTAAANIMNTTQPGISRMLAQLQDTTGVKLFDLQRGRLLPTPEAKELFQSVQQHFFGLDKIEQTVASLRSSGVGLLRIAATPVLSLSVIPQAVQKFKAEFPKAQMTIRTVSTDQMREGLLNGLYDFAISTSNIQATGVESVLLHEDRSVCVMHPSHPLSDQSAVDVRDLRKCTLLVHHNDDTQHQLLARVMKKQSVVPESIVETSYSATICALAAAGVGVGIVSSYAASMFQDNICIKRFYPELLIQTHMAFAPQQAPSPLTTRFVEHLNHHFQALQAQSD